MRELIEKADVFQRAHDREHAEKTRQRLEIKIPDVLRVGRYNYRRRDGGDERDEHHRVLFDKVRHGVVLFVCRRVVFCSAERPAAFDLRLRNLPPNNDNFRPIILPRMKKSKWNLRKNEVFLPLTMVFNAFPDRIRQKNRGGCCPPL